jgi:hypothetical protein
VWLGGRSSADPSDVASWRWPLRIEAGGADAACTVGELGPVGGLGAFAGLGLAFVNAPGLPVVVERVEVTCG